ncbi:purine-nucleoside phosphorylase [Mobiluncus mulieris]|uniref:purine-nucleoside phosphorylase n=1 Tax=Mobiluncus mulieris TaxID=2052 RepID=UPI00242D8BEF|nr:purine-nucleoside phosphorylase [Mobiluncus mulieris]
MSTPHISAEPGDFAPAVLMPGDPKRAERIAHMLMPDAKMVTEVRGMMGFTGTYEGKPLSVMGSGMGQPSLTIYATELFKFYGVQRIIRVGTCGSISPLAQVGDTVVAMTAHTDSHINVARFPEISFAPCASWNLLSAAMRAVETLPETDRGRVHVGSVFSEDHFYFKTPGLLEKLTAYGTLGLEMETAALYGAAAEFGKEALTVLTVSDNLLDSSKDMTPAERETKFVNTLKLAAAAALS